MNHPRLPGLAEEGDNPFNEPQSETSDQDIPF